jgi:hypothetical protein
MLNPQFLGPDMVTDIYTLHNGDWESGFRFTLKLKRFYARSEPREVSRSFSLSISRYAKPLDCFREI